MLPQKEADAPPAAVHDSRRGNLAGATLVSKRTGGGWTPDYAGTRPARNLFERALMTQASSNNVNYIQTPKFY